MDVVLNVASVVIKYRPQYRVAGDDAWPVKTVLVIMIIAIAALKL